MQSFEVNPNHLMRDIYSYPFPEVRARLQSQQLDPRFMLNTLPVAQADELLEPYGFQSPLALPAGPDGALDLDELHTPIIDRITNKLAPQLPGLADYANRYPTPGSSQAMFTLMAEWAARSEMTSLACLVGEYEGYAANAENLQLPVHRYERLVDNPVTPGEVWFVSNPSALNGNAIDPADWEAFLAAGHQVVYDAAYIGLTDGKTVAVNSPNIKAVLTSPSKNFGVFRYRQTGVVYSREPVNSLYGTKWFKDVPALLDTLSLYEAYGGYTLPNRYKDWQHAICRALDAYLRTEVVPSDVLLLATAPNAIDDKTLAGFRRGRVIRFGLTKLFEDYEASLKAQV